MAVASARAQAAEHCPVSRSSDTGIVCETEGFLSKWYTKRPLPEFRLRIFRGGIPYCDTMGWEVTVRLQTGDGIFDDDGELLRGRVASEALHFPVINGVATISGLRFQAVSSKNGKFFRLELKCSGKGTEGMPPHFTSNIKILSERLKNERKAANISELRPKDDIARIPGIGKSYCQRLNQMGYHTVQDLARISMNPADRPARLAVLHKLRKDRGALTEAKLMEYVRDAHQVVRESLPRVGSCSGLAAAAAAAHGQYCGSAGQVGIPTLMPATLDDEYQRAQVKLQHNSLCHFNMPSEGMGSLVPFTPQAEADSMIDFSRGVADLDD